MKLLIIRILFVVPFAFMVLGIIAVIRIMIIMKTIKGKEKWKLDDDLIPEEDYNRKYKGTLGVPDDV